MSIHTSRTNQVADRIVNLHQPYARPIVRGKEQAKVEFGINLEVSLVDGFMFIDKLSWMPSMREHALKIQSPNIMVTSTIILLKFSLIKSIVHGKTGNG